MNSFNNVNWGCLGSLSIMDQIWSTQLKNDLQAPRHKRTFGNIKQNFQCNQRKEFFHKGLFTNFVYKTRQVHRWSKNCHFLSTCIPQKMSTLVVKTSQTLVNVVCERPLTKNDRYCLQIGLEAPEKHKYIQKYLYIFSKRKKLIKLCLYFRFFSVLTTQWEIRSYK